MLAEFLNTILEKVDPKMFHVTDVNGVESPYASKPLVQVKAAPQPLPTFIEVGTLAGLAGLVKAKLEDKNIAQDFIFHIVNESKVVLQAVVSDVHGRRLTLATATPVEFAHFRFGCWMSQEEFAIAVAALFADTPDRDYVLKVASTLINEATSTNEDDGFAQKATLRAGLRMKESVTLKPRVAMAPYRTFPEVPQPVSDFVLRARCPEGQNPSLMLVEADGGHWKLDAIQNIAEALRTLCPEVQVIA